VGRLRRQRGLRCQQRVVRTIKSTAAEQGDAEDEKSE
jgi:hypothetical protein